MHGSLDFVDTNDFVVMNSGEHYTASDVEWDPTGRYVVTGVSYWKQKVHNFFLSKTFPCNFNSLKKKFFDTWRNEMKLFLRWTTDSGCGHSRARG